MSMRGKLYALIALAVAGLLVLSALALVGQRKVMLEDRIDKVRALVESSASMIGYYEAQAREGKLAQPDAQRLALAAITAQRFDQDEYFFILDGNMVTVAHGVNPRLLGKSMDGIKDVDGQNLGQLFRTAATQGGGLAEYRWNKPDQEDPVGKVVWLGGASSQWGWHVGTGIYVDDIDAAFWRQSALLLGVVGVLSVLLLVVSTLIVRNLIRGLGGEPAYAIEVVRKIAAGRLNEPVQLAAGDKDSLLASIAQMQGALRELIGEITTSADRLSAMSVSIESSAEHNAQQSEQQSQAASAMAAAIEQLTTSIHHIADSAQQARERSQQAGDESRQSGEVINRAVGEMEMISQEVSAASTTIGELVDKTESIRSIMEVIRDVADQTNLLALNAAIEAARAGEQGRGFAVVADEVRKLAERTTASTQQIASMLGAIHVASDASRSTIEQAVSRAGNGVTLAAEGGEAVERIRQSTAGVVGVIGDISHALGEQSEASKEIARHVEQISQGAGASAVEAHQTAEATEALNRLTQSLRSSVSRFEL
ncbi:methyl-accepting chemotaxis protein [Crenobacter intestini]|uniref:Methyl-accepting chemotaxis protein n=1 Tax=Crenobacter intestini TaxID=2563443 RepID=A0A4V4N782_9NEIS|nr:methyl-accepting chemotaxis protein [Crenobacter intestini]